MRLLYRLLCLWVLLVLASPLGAVVSTVNFSVQQMTLSKNETTVIDISVLDSLGAPVSGTAVTLSVLSGTLNAVQALATTDVLGVATFSITAAASPTEAILAAYCEAITSNTTLTVNIVVARPVINPVSSPTSAIMQVITGIKTVDITTINITVNTGLVESPVDYPSATSWVATINNMAEGLCIITVNAIDSDANSSNWVTASIRVDLTSPSITLKAPTSNGYDNNDIAVEYALSEPCLAGSVVMIFTVTGSSTDINSPHLVTAGFTVLAGTNTLWITGNDLNNDGEAVTSDVLVDGALYDVAIRATDLVGNQSLITVNSSFTYDILPPAPATSLVANAYPSSHLVLLQWNASPSADVGTYRIYRGLDPVWITSNIGVTVNLTFSDTTPVSATNNYYQVVAVDWAGNASVTSNMISAGNIAITKTANVKTGGLPSATIPGATITYSLIFNNDGYGIVSGIAVTDIVPTIDVAFKQGSATADVTCNILYQHDVGGAFNASDAGIITGIKWDNFPSINAGQTVTLSYSVIIQ